MTPIVLPRAGADGLDIRDCRPDDAARVAALIATVFAVFRARFAPTAIKWTEDAVARTAPQWLIAERRGHGLIGVVHHLPDELGYTFDAMSVHVGHRRCSVGSALYAEVERRARASAAGQMIIAVRDELVQNVSFATHLGFTRTVPHGAAHHVWTKPLGAAR